MVDLEKSHGKAYELAYRKTRNFDGVIIWRLIDAQNEVFFNLTMFNFGDLHVAYVQYIFY